MNHQGDDGLNHDPDPATTTAAHLLAVAPPGCGKTELLARRALHLVPELDTHQQILALTFSNRAKRNLADRLQRVLGAQRFRRLVHVTNFHGHAASIIRAHGGAIGVAPDAPLPDRTTLADALARHTGHLPSWRVAEVRRSIEGTLAEVKRGPFDDDEVDAALVAAGDGYALEIERERRAAGVLHFDDLLRHAQRLLRIKEIAQLYQCRYGALLVDEFQDLSPQQLDLALSSCDRSRTFVGDPLQGIYGWAGARPAEVEARLLQVCGAPVRLGVSYRSSPAVLAVVNTVAATLGAAPLTAAAPDSWPDGGFAASGVFPTGAAEAEWIVESTQLIVKADPRATVGVIARAAWRRKEVDTAFAAAGITHRRWDQGIDDSEFLEQLSRALGSAPQDADIVTIRQLVLAHVPGDDVDTRDRTFDALDAFEELVDQLGSVSAAYAQLHEPPETDDAIEPGVHVLNAHTGKGQQFDWVFVPGLEESHIPAFQADTDEKVAEEHRALLVILSRARLGVVITRAETRLSNAGRDYRLSPSPWWADTAGACPLTLDEVRNVIAAL